MGSEQSTQSKPPKNIGTALIFNHEKFPGHPEKLATREGTEKDVENLCSSLQNIGFNVIVKYDLTTEQVHGTINYFATCETFPNTNCLLVVVLSHGDKGGIIYSKNSQYLTKDIWDPFKSCEALKGKPKLFIFQACRGHLSDQKIIENGIATLNYRANASSSLQEDDVASNNKLINKLPKLPEHSDFFIAYSTVEHRQSKRHIVDGTWYIETLCQELDKLQTSEEVFQFMTRVTNRVVTRRDRANGQTPSFVSLLHGPVYIPSPANTADVNTSHDVDVTDEGLRNDSTSPKLQISEISWDRANFDLEMIRNDGQGSQSQDNPVSPTQLKYPWQHKNPGRAIIFFAGENYKTFAIDFEEYIMKCLSFSTKIIELRDGKENFQQHLLKEKNDGALRDDSCLLVAIFASIEHIEVPEEFVEECYINIQRDSYPINFAWSPFLASNCTYLVGKPKLFFFLDPQNDIRSDCRKNRKDEPEAAAFPSVTEHSDFIFVNGFSNAFYRSLLEELRKSAENKSDIHTIITNAMKSEKQYNRLSHFESTLKYQLVFEKKKNEITDEKKKEIIANPLRNLNQNRVRLQSLISIYCKIREKRIFEKLKTQIITLKKEAIVTENKNFKLQDDLLYIKRKIKQSTVEDLLVIENIPSTESENLQNIVQQVFELYNIPNCNQSDIQEIYRQNKTDKIIVKLTTKTLRNNIVNLSRKQKVYVNKLGYESRERIYINPYLTSANYAVFNYAVKKLKDSNGLNYKYVTYTIKGNIYARKSENTKMILIKSTRMIDQMIEFPEKYER